MKAIGKNAFYLCWSLEHVDIGDSVKSIGTNAFYGITFLDADGNKLPRTAQALRGHAFVGSDRILRAVS